MRCTQYVFLLLLFVLSVLLAGCDFRDILDDYPVSGVKIKVNWKGVDKLPEGMRVIFYPKSEEGRKVESYLSVEGGEVKVPPGRYDMVIYNYNTESVLIRNDDAYETIEVYTDYCKGLETSEKMVWSPDPLYVVSMNDMRIEKSEDVLLMEFQPKLVVKNYSFEIKVKGLKNVDYYKEGGIYKYTYGASPDYNKVLRSKRSITDKFKDAFIIAFKNGEKINVNTAISEFKKNRNK